tara:strand:- start:349 stop:579 length:231 start_codon:yes stop_codon:yes gene_type:complete
MKDIEISETGVITIIAMFLTFSAACCRAIQSSRCSTIKSPCVSCEREVLNEETLLEMRRMEEANETKPTATQVSPK